MKAMEKPNGEKKMCVWVAVVFWCSILFCKIAASAFEATRHMNTTHVPYAHYSPFPPRVVPTHRHHAITVVSLHFIWFLWKLTMMRLASNIRTYASTKLCLYAETNDMYPAPNMLCSTYASLATTNRRCRRHASSVHYYISLAFSFGIIVPTNHPHIILVTISPQCCHWCHQQQQQSTSCKWIFILCFFFLSPSLVSLRVIISKQFGSSTLLHGSELLPQLWMHYVSVHSSKSMATIRVTQKWRIAPASPIADIGTYFIYCANGKSSGTVYYGNVKLLTIERSPFLFPTRICCHCRSELCCVAF